jgi:hypothetical protein
MIINLSLIRRLIQFTLSCFIVLSISIFEGYGQQIADTSDIKQKDSMDIQNNMMIPSAFYTQMGVPINVGNFDLKMAALPTINDGKTKTQFNFQVATGLSKTVTFYLDGKALFYNPMIEESLQFPVIDAMFQFSVLKSENGLCGFSPFIEFEFPWWEAHTRSIYTLVGYAATLSNSHFAFDQVLHYNPLKDLAEGSASLVVKVSKRIFLVSEVSGVTQTNTRPVFNLLGGVKVKFNKDFLLGLAYQIPLTDNRDYSSQYVFQPDIIFQ